MSANKPENMPAPIHEAFIKKNKTGRSKCQHSQIVQRNHINDFTCDCDDDKVLVEGSTEQMSSVVAMT